MDQSAFLWDQHTKQINGITCTVGLLRGQERRDGSPSHLKQPACTVLTCLRFLMSRVNPRRKWAHETGLEESLAGEELLARRLARVFPFVTPGQTGVIAQALTPASQIVRRTLAPALATPHVFRHHHAMARRMPTTDSIRKRILGSHRCAALFGRFPDGNSGLLIGLCPDRTGIDHENECDEETTSDPRGLHGNLLSLGPFCSA